MVHDKVTNLLFVDDAGGAHAFDMGAKCKQCLDFFFCNVIWHNDRWASRSDA